MTRSRSVILIGGDQGVGKTLTANALSKSLSKSQIRTLILDDWEDAASWRGIGSAYREADGLLAGRVERLNQDPEVVHQDVVIIVTISGAEIPPPSLVKFAKEHGLKSIQACYLSDDHGPKKYIFDTGMRTLCGVRSYPDPMGSALNSAIKEMRSTRRRGYRFERFTEGPD